MMPTASFMPEGLLSSSSLVSFLNEERAKRIERQYFVSKQRGSTEGVELGLIPEAETYQCASIARPVRLTLPESFEFPGWLEKSLIRIAEIEKLPPNWDSYGSPAPDHSICNLAKVLLFKISDFEGIDPFIAPVSGGYLFIEVKHKRRELEIELNDPSGIYASCLTVENSPREETQEKTIALETEFKQMILWLLDQPESLLMVA